MMITGILAGVQTSLAPYILKLIIDGIANFDGDKTQIFSVIKIPVLMYILIFVFATLVFRMNDWLELRAIPGVRHGILVSMFAYLKKHSHEFFQNHFAGSLLNKIIDMQGSVASILQKLDMAFSSIATLVIAIGGMFLVHSLFAGILLIWAVGFIGVSILFTKQIKERSYSFSSSKTIVSGKIVDSISNVINSRLFARESYELSQVDVAMQDAVNKDRIMQMYILKMRFLQDISIIFLMASMLISLVIMYEKGLVTVGDFAFVLTVSVSIFQTIWFLASQFVQFSEELGKSMQALSIINIPHKIIDFPTAKPLHVTKGQIEFDEVTFHYNKNQSIFKNKKVIIKPGSKTGLVGFSGSGKTTFVNLILRLFDVESGRILIDGQDISKVTQESLHHSISMIPQDVSLFHRTLMENIRYGKLDATDEEVIEVSKHAHCHEFISLLPENYNTLVGERGIKLSGGQRQRIAIARAMLKNAPILILDEATSALDSVTEKHIQESLKELMKKCTSIVIAHRLSTLSEMDRILVFHNGQIIEEGNHQELLKAKGHYYKMWQMQAGGFLPENE